MTVWITRTRPGANRTAARLAARGIETLIDPVLEVRRLPVRLDLNGFDALAFTSPNGVEAFTALTGERGLPAFAVGEATAEALMDAGFSRIETAAGDVGALARTLAAARPGRVLYAAPRQPAGDLAALASGVEIEALPIYETVARTPVAALEAEGLTAALVHSARAGRILAEQARGRLEALDLFAISAAAATPLIGVRTKSLRIAPFPDDTSLARLCADTLSDVSA